MLRTNFCFGIYSYIHNYVLLTLIWNGITIISNNIYFQRLGLIRNMVNVDRTHRNKSSLESSVVIFKSVKRF